VKRFIFVILLLLSNTIFAQTFFKSWYCESDNVCFEIKEKGFSCIGELARLKVKVRRDILIIKLKGYGIDLSPIVWKFKIEKISDDELIITRDLAKNKFEFFTSSHIVLKSRNCDCIP
jgi:hypothetical protein